MLIDLKFKWASMKYESHLFTDDVKCSHFDDTVNHFKSEYNQLAQKEYRIKFDWKGKVIHCKLCKTNGICTNQKLLNKMRKTLWNFVWQMNYLILITRPDLLIRKITYLMNFPISADYREKIKVKNLTSIWTLTKNWKSCDR